MNKIMIASIAPIASRRVVISVAMRPSREREKERSGEKGGVYKTMEKDEKTRTYIFKQRKKIEEKEGKRKRQEA